MKFGGPREDSFFDDFQKQAQFAKEAGDMLVNLLNDFDNIEVHLRSLKEKERQGDKLVHEIAKKIAKSFVTPIDREDIHAITANFDDILDLIESSSVNLYIYNVSKPTETALQLAEIIQKMTALLVEAIACLSELQDIDKLREEIKLLEREADKIFREAVAKLFRSDIEPIELIKWKEIYRSLETVTDHCKEVMNILEGVIIKYA